MASALPNLPTVDRASAGGVPTRARRLDTTCLCTIDADGNAFSASMSDTLDGAPLVPGLGIMVSPRGVQSRLDADHPACVAPHKRPRLTPAPALASRRAPGAGDLLVWPFGCPGGDVILQALLQAFLNVVHFEMTPQQAVEAPRVGCFSFPDSFFPNVEVEGRVSVEEGIGEGVRAELRARGHEVVSWPELEFDAGGVNMVLDLEPPRDGRRVLAAGADPRHSCYALGR
jgi:gamma-glutamyltranspeptidase/glutathione hydrolase